jgi:hypothetical protein
MKIAVATLGNFHAKPFGPELQVKQMFSGRFAPRKELFEDNNFVGKIYQHNFVLFDNYLQKMLILYIVSK